MSDNFIQENSEIITLRAMANVFMPEALDPVGQEDNDPDNDGNENDPNDKYIMKRRKAIGAAIDKRKKKLKEAASADAHTSDDDEEEIVEKKVKNKVTINPQMESKGYYDPMEDDEFDHDEAEKNRGVSGKNNPKGGKRLYKKPKRKSVEEAVNTPTSDYNRAKQLNSPASPTGGQRPPASMDPRNKPGIDPLTGVKMASAGTGPKLKPGSGLGGGKPVYPKGQEPKPTGATLPNLQTAGYEPEGDQLDEKSIQMQRRVDRYLGRDKAKAKERLKKQNDRKVKKAALAALEKHAKGMKAGIYDSYEAEGEQLQEKPGDGYLGPTVNVGGAPLGVPNPIRMAKDVVDKTNRNSQKKVDMINKISPGSASMPKVDYFNKGPSQASQRLLGLSHEPEGEQLNERPYQVMGYDKEGKKEKKVGKPVKSKKYAQDRAAELEDTHKKTGGKYRAQYVEGYRSKHRPPAGWKPYGGDEKGPVPEVDATAKRIDAIRKSIKTKKKKKD